MANTFDITKHPFLLEVQKNIQPLAMGLIDAIPKVPMSIADRLKKNWQETTASERYTINVFGKCMNLNRVIQRLNVARYLLSQSPSPYETKKVSLNRCDWTEYNFYVYTTSIASILDCTLILTDEVYQLGIPHRFCNFELIRQCQRIKGTKIAKSLQELNRHLQCHIKRRHGYLHRGENSSLGDLIDPDIFWCLDVMTFMDDKSNSSIPTRTIPPLWKSTIREIIPKLRSYETNIFTSMSDVLTALRAQYETILCAYRELANSLQCGAKQD